MAKTGAKLAASAALAAKRAEYAVMDKVAPAKAARKAALDWCTLPDNAGRRKDNRASQGETTYVRGPRGTKILTESWGDGPLVYLVHGWGGWRGQVAAFAEPIAAAGYRVVSFDALSHGDSDAGRWGPRHSTGAELADSLMAVLEDIGEPFGLVAHSLGCSSAAYAIANEAPVQRLALVSPNPDLVDPAYAFARYLGLRHSVALRMMGEVEKMAGRDVADFDIAKLALARPFPRALLVHDRADKEAPYASTERLAGELTNCELVTTDGLGHHRILIDRGVIARVAEFVAS